MEYHTKNIADTCSVFSKIYNNQREQVKNANVYNSVSNIIYAITKAFRILKPNWSQDPTEIINLIFLILYY